MVKLLIVDDEFHIRDGIATAVAWEDIGVKVVGTAADAVEAMEMWDEHRPELVITDINLGTGMNGLELGELIAAAAPQTRIIILSGYDEFEFARKALELKVVSYLLKPVLPSELLNLVCKTIEEIREENDRRKRLKYMELQHEENKPAAVNQLMERILEGHVTGDHDLQKKMEMLDIRLQGNYYTCLLLAVEGMHERLEPVGTNEFNKALATVKQAFLQGLPPAYSVCAGESRSYEIRIVIGCKSKRSYNQLESTIQHILVKLAQSHGIIVIASIGNCYPSLDQVCQSHSEAILAMDYRLIAGEDRFIRIEDVYKLQSRKFKYPAEQEANLLSSLQQNEDRVMECIDQFFSALEIQNCLNGDFRLSVIQLFAAVSQQFKEMGVDWSGIYERKQANPFYVLEQMNHAHAIKKWFTGIVLGALSQTRFRTDGLSGGKRVIQKAKEYMDQHYTDSDISLQAIAEHVYLNPTYFSKLFKQETGETYMEYITNVRIHHAKKLLKETNLRMNDIGMATGYPNPTYFSSKFKKMTGFTPLEFREK